MATLTGCLAMLEDWLPAARRRHPRWYDADRMFGMGGTEILVILIVALLFLGPEKLPDAAKSISKGIRDLRKQTREFQETIEADEKIGGAIRDLKSALNGEEPRRVRPPRPLPGATTPEAAAAATAAITEGITTGEPLATSTEEVPAGAETANAAATVTLPVTAGESAVPADGDPDPADDAKDLAALIKPAEGAIAKGTTNGHG